MGSTRPTLQQAQGEFMARSQRTRSKRTMNNYQSTFTQFSHDAFKMKDVYLESVNTMHIEQFVNRYDNPGTANQTLGHLRVFFSWCIKTGYLKRNPCDPIDNRPTVKRGAVVKSRIPAKDWSRLLDIADEYHPMDRAVIACGMYLGSRGSEIRHIKLGDIQRGSTGQIEKIRVMRSKQYWEAWVPVAGELAEELERWLSWYADKMGELPPNAYLFPTRDPGKRAHRSDGTFEYVDSQSMPLKMYNHIGQFAHHRIVHRVLKRAGYYQRGEGTHTLRRSVAAALYEEDIERGYGEALDTVRTFLGHKHTSTTETYIGTSFSERKLEERLIGKHMFRHNAAEAADNVIPLREEGLG